MPESLSASAQRQLERLGVEVRTGSLVTAIDGEGLEVRPPQGEAGRIPSRCVVWAAGVAASPLGRQIAQATGAQTDRAGRVLVEPDLGVPGHPEISVIGDLAAARSHRAGHEPTPVPGVSPAAKQMGRTAAANVVRRLAGRPTEAFRYRDYGNLATIGRNSAVVDLWTPWRRIDFSGWFAWVFWLFAHIYFLIGFRNRLVVLIDWGSAYWSSQRYARVVTGLPPGTTGQLTRLHTGAPPPGASSMPYLHIGPVTAPDRRHPILIMPRLPNYIIALYPSSSAWSACSATSFRLPHVVGIQLLHAAQPAVVVLRLGQESTAPPGVGRARKRSSRMVCTTTSATCSGVSTPLIPADPVPSRVMSVCTDCGHRQDTRRPWRP